MPRLQGGYSFLIEALHQMSNGITHAVARFLRRLGEALATCHGQHGFGSCDVNRWLAWGAAHLFQHLLFFFAQSTQWVVLTSSHESSPDRGLIQSSCYCTSSSQWQQAEQVTH